MHRIVSCGRAGFVASVGLSCVLLAPVWSPPALAGTGHPCEQPIRKGQSDADPRAVPVANGDQGELVVARSQQVAESPAAASEGVAGHVLIGLWRVDDYFFPNAEFVLFVGLDFPNSDEADSVTIITGGGAVIELEGPFDEGLVAWEEEMPFDSLEGLRAAAHGTWTIVIAGPSPSTSTFALNAAALADGDFYPTPTGVFPPSGSVNVPPDVTFSWNDPTGDDTADVLVVGVESDESWDDASTIDGTIEIDATSWAPSESLSPGFAEFFVLYLRFDGDGLAGPLSVTSGDMTWGMHPLAPDGYPASTPLLLLGSETIVAFDVAGASSCPADLNGDDAVDVLDLLMLLDAWGPAPGGHAADLNDDGAVDVLDLLMLLDAWGPCA
jgi:hypothetical protein